VTILESVEQVEGGRSELGVDGERLVVDLDGG
jgi:hypothetical protein